MLVLIGKVGKIILRPPTCTNQSISNTISMSTQQQIINFQELVGSVRGEGLERLTSMLGDRLGLSSVWTGRGPDAGKDLTFTEIISGPLCNRVVKWVVSCKDKAQSGDTVQEKDLPNIADKVKQHRAQGFLLVTTTTVGVAAKNLLDNNDLSAGGDVHTKVWDSSDLSNMLLQPSNHDLLKQFLPNSYRRMNRIDASVEDALAILKRSLPVSSYSEIARTVADAERPTQNEDLLKETNLWPYNPSFAFDIDQITKYLIDEHKIDEAVAATEDIDINAFFAFVDRLYLLYPSECYDYLIAIIHGHPDGDFVFNAYEFLADHEIISGEDRIKYASYLHEDELSLIYGSDIEQFVQQEALSNTNAYGIDAAFNGLSGMTALEHIDYVTVSTLTIEAESESIRFAGSLEVSATLSHGPDAPNSEVEVKGSYSGYIDINNFHLESVSLRTQELDDFDLEFFNDTEEDEQDSPLDVR